MALVKSPVLTSYQKFCEFMWDSNMEMEDHPDGYPCIFVADDKDFSIAFVYPADFETNEKDS